MLIDAMIIAGHDLVLKYFASYPMPGTTNENRENISQDGTVSGPSF
jgi:hypothetical protein